MRKQIFDDYYVMTDGKVISTKLNTTTELKGGYVSRKRNYRVVLLYLNGKCKTYYVHRLVAEAFIPNPLNLPCINHIDGNPQNNNVDNLEWCSYSANINHAYRTGLMSTHKCELCGKEKFNKINKICGDCNAKINSLEISKTNKENKLNKIQKELDYIDVSEVPTRYYEIFVMRKQGKTYQEIANKLNISRQRVQQKLNALKENIQKQIDNKEKQQEIRYIFNYQRKGV